MATTRKQMFLEKMNGGSLSTPTPVTIEEEILDGTSGHTLPAVSSSDVDKVLQVVNGKWVADWIDRSTTLFTDGTLIINEKLEDRDSNISKHGAVVKEYEPYGEKNPYVFKMVNNSTAFDTPWYDDRENILSVEIGSKIQPTDMSYWFGRFTNMTSCNLTNIDTSKVERFINTFYKCSSLIALDCTSLNTSNAINLVGMFQECGKLENLNIQSFITSNVTDMAGMFNGCKKLKQLDISKFNTSNVKGFGATFSICSELEILDLRSFDVSNVLNILGMFMNSSKLKTIIVSSKCDFSNISNNNSSYAFFGCTSLVGGAGTIYDAFLEDQIPLYSLTAHAFAGVKGITKGILQRARRKKYISFTAQDVINELILPKNAFTRIVRRDEDEVYTDEEMSLIMQYCTENRDTWSDCIKLIFITGLRIGEATSIKHEDIDIDNLCIHIYKTESRYRDENGMVRTCVGETTKTDAGFRKVYIPKQFEKFLRSLWERSANTTWVFEYNGRRVHTNAIRKKLKRICEAVEVPYKSPHKIRKTFCSILLDNNINQSFIKAQMGHTDISTSEMYYHRDRVNSKKKVETLSAIEEFSMV